jgi:hypothetical protein
MEAPIRELVERGALFVINHSGGKDSQAMATVMRRVIPADQLLVIHAELGEVEWDGIVGHIEATALTLLRVGLWRDLSERERAAPDYHVKGPVWMVVPVTHTPAETGLRRSMTCAAVRRSIPSCATSLVDPSTRVPLL